MVVLEGALAHGVKADESTWTIDTEHNVINITLFKVHRLRADSIRTYHVMLAR